MVRQKQSSSPAPKKKEYTKSGNPLTELEFAAMVKESEESGYMSLEEFKKKCLALLHSK